MVTFYLYYVCPVHGHFSLSKVGLGEKWNREEQCPRCGALSKRDDRMTSVRYSD